MNENSTDDTKSGLYGAVAVLVCAVSMGYLAISALIRGTAWFPRRQEPKLFERGSSPLEYWLLVCFYLVLLGSGLWRFARILQKEMKSPNQSSTDQRP